MRILFDQGTPVPLRRSLSAHAVSTAYEMGLPTIVAAIEALTPGQYLELSLS